MAIINIGILAHVDAGKTSLTERILYETGVIKSVGSVDKGTTQTDTLELEQARGITIRSAVVSFQLNDLKVNLVDTPGHPDFVAEVERSLHVLDGVVLVVSAVEGVQSQTRRLMQAVRAASLPLLVFINKVDRAGARDGPLLEDIRRKLKLRLVPLTSVVGAGARSAEIVACDRQVPGWRESVTDLLAETNVRVIEEYERTQGDLSDDFLAMVLREEVAAGNVTPVYFGSAITGVGVPALLAGIEEWLPPADEVLDGPVGATVFKIIRQPSGEKIVFARLFSGSLRVRRREALQRRDVLGDPSQVEERITGIDRFLAGRVTPAEFASAGEIVGLHGLRSARIGDWIGRADNPTAINTAVFAAPALESAVSPVDPGDVTRLRAALEQLAEQDPLISLRQRNDAGEISMRLYGEVQKEVMVEMLSHHFGIAVTFGPSQTICIERPVGEGEHVENLTDMDNPFFATVGFRIAPAEGGSGILYEQELGALPLAFYRAIEETVHETLGQGLCGWEVTDCAVTLTHRGMVPESTAADFRKLTPLALMSALRVAGTEVQEPVEELDLEIPEDAFGAVCGALVSARATIRSVYPDGSSQHIICEIPTAELHGIEQQVPGLTRGEGSWISSSAGHRPVTDEPPVRTRFGPNPLNRAQYLAHVARS